MILEDKIEINITNRNKKRLKELGYNIEKDKILIKPTDLPNGSHEEITAICECGDQNKIRYHKYIENLSRGGIYRCKKCSQKTREKSIKDKFGVDNVMKLEEFKEKSKITKLKKYGNENYNNIEKYIKTNLKKGYEFPIQNEKIKEKIFENSKLTIKLKNIKKYKNYNIIDYSNGKFIHMCEKGHISVLTRNTLKSRIYYNLNLCKKCYPPYESLIEFTVYNNIKNIYKNKIIRNDRKEIGIELDVFLPELKIAFEINGLYWHSNKFKDKYYHKNKLEKCINKKID
jgi:hypothetical protein